MLLSKELPSSSHGYSDSFSWTLALWRGNYGHQRSVLWGGILSLSIIFSVQVWQWRILTIKKETLYEKSNIISFYTFVIEITLTKEPWSLCYLVVFFGFHSHYLHPNVTWFPVVLVARKHGLTVLLCPFITILGIFTRCVSYSRNFLVCCERKYFPILMWSKFNIVLCNSLLWKGYFQGCR